MMKSLYSAIAGAVMLTASAGVQAGTSYPYIYEPFVSGDRTYGGFYLFMTNNEYCYMVTSDPNYGAMAANAAGAVYNRAQLSMQADQYGRCVILETIIPQ